MFSEEDTLYMRRCLELADNGAGYVAPNPSVGAVVVYDGRIIGEGYHQRYGEKHAEVNAIASVKNKSLLKQSVMYVSLEPCSHQGKQPPCCDLIIHCGISKVVIATEDPNPLVAGTGIQRLREVGIDVQVGLLKEKAQEQNRRFFTYQMEKRPYIILKWAQSSDGFIDKNRDINTPPEWLTGPLGQLLVHRWRTEEPAIMVGANTVIRDNPQLTARKWVGKNPLRVVFDKDLSLSKTAAVFNRQASTLVFTYAEKFDIKEYPASVEIQPISLTKDMDEQLLIELYKRNIQSVFIEGGGKILNRFINKGLWDEARIFTASKELKDGLRAPSISGVLVEKSCSPDFDLKIFRNKK
ncbi:MAG: bifunctional diaminohydroxyphosphoribosylaminopyrimidine deaminase/5-amino-6-(5-phosphoribosylamino)uracil reductase RibD [Prevotellaceae bacterium]|jgi:diaminohydroxyphosphoribosylaminopyrimidine deaminase/5-amino-6-(5-phosphoribosylamino)uracil reductase|nr:bifunctional diaminohydroxyphosphoribosylaminopyrimidine deaminase/5-amino-6-(5-phosphoribosylamino)uracil reductase RibD [Prevotellaceae bacterium]